MTNIISSAYLAHVEWATREVDEEDQHTFTARQMPLEMHAFLLSWFVHAAEKGKTAGDDYAPAPAPIPKAKRGRGKATTSRGAAKKPAEEWSWIDQVPATLALISKVLRLNVEKIWQTTVEKDTFIK